MDLSTFHRFPFLPKEIRLMIWRTATLQIPPQYITITATSLRRGHPQRAGSDATNTKSEFRCQREAPAMLSVCQESRHEALKRYKSLEAGILDTEGLDIKTGRLYHTRCRHVSVQSDDFDRDFALDPQGSVISSLAGKLEIAEPIVVLAVCPCEITNPRPFELLQELQKYKNLKELVFIRMIPEDVRRRANEPMPRPGSSAEATAIKDRLTDRTREAQFWWLMTGVVTGLARDLTRLVRDDPSLSIPKMTFMVGTDANGV